MVTLLELRYLSLRMVVHVLYQKFSPSPPSSWWFRSQTTEIVQFSLLIRLQCTWVHTQLQIPYSQPSVLVFWLKFNHTSWVCHVFTRLTVGPGFLVLCTLYVQSVTHHLCSGVLAVADCHLSGGSSICLTREHLWPSILEPIAQGPLGCLLRLFINSFHANGNANLSIIICLLHNTPPSHMPPFPHWRAPMTRSPLSFLSPTTTANSLRPSPQCTHILPNSFNFIHSYPCSASSVCLSGCLFVLSVVSASTNKSCFTYWLWIANSWYW